MRRAVIAQRKARKLRGQALGLAICAAGVGVWIPVVTTKVPVNGLTLAETFAGIVLVVLGLMIHEVARGLSVAPPPCRTIWLGAEGVRRLELMKRRQAVCGGLAAMGEELDAC